MRTRLHRAFACGAALLACAALAQPATPWPTQDWAVSTPQAEGVDPALLAEMVDYLATPRFNTDSVIVVRHGRIVLEAYAAPYHADLRHDLRSITKSVVATLVGAAIQEGRIASDQQKVLAFFPEHPPTGPRQQALNVRHLLDMTSGLAWREWPYDAESDAHKLWGAADWTRFILERDFSSEPGEKFQYIAAAPHLLSVVLTRSTGANAAEYGRRHLFKALGIGDFTWHSDPQGHSVGESALRLKPRDMARIGLLHLREGRWEDRQLLPPGWTEALFSAPGVPTAPGNGLPTYRSLWWTDASLPVAAAQGRHGQHILLLPRQDLMLVVTSKTADASPGASGTLLVQRYLLPAVTPRAALRLESAGTSALAAAVERFNQRRGHASQTPSPAALASAGRTFVLEPNAWNYSEFGLALAAPQPHYWLVQADRNARNGSARRGGAMGLDGRYVVSTRAGDTLWARRGRWVDGNSFRIETQHLESAIVAEWTARFLDDGRLELLYTNGDGETLLMRGNARE